jgi:hypothetical protein
MKGDVFMDKKELNNVSDSVSPKAVVPSTQPVPKREDEVRANTAPNSKKSDSNPTL